MSCRLDHITITAPTLEAGSDLVFRQLGVRPQPGGAHPRMGTHNLLLRLGDGMFLEVIAVDPGATRPARPRWFELDRLTDATPPRLACWVARTDDVERELPRASEPLGVIEPMSRGALEWVLTIPADGSLPLGGVAPALIQWHAERHPALSMQAQGCGLDSLVLAHPQPDRVANLLHQLDVAEPGVTLRVEHAAAPRLTAHIRAPHGLRWLGEV